MRFNDQCDPYVNEMINTQQSINQNEFKKLRETLQKLSQLRIRSLQADKTV